MITSHMCKNKDSNHYDCPIRVNESRRNVVTRIDAHAIYNFTSNLMGVTVTISAPIGH